MTKQGKLVPVAAVLAAGLVSASAPTSLNAQGPTTELRPPVVFAGVQAQYARPSGEFLDYVQHGGGLNVGVVWPVRAGGVFALRADGGFIVYGSETKRVCFSTTVGCRVQLDLTTTNSIAYGNIGPQLMVPSGPVRPYANAAAGFSYFGTTSEVEGSNEQDEPFASSTNFDDVTFAWAAGGGVLIPLSSGRTPILLDLGARYHGNGEVEYLKEGDITDNPDGSITYDPTRSEANLWTFQIGVSVGIRPGAAGNDD
ncbi:MAG: hypothetical protein WEF86_08630 [Gemmatimonadota bacterium]